MPEFDDTPLPPTGPDETPHRRLTADGVATTSALGRDLLQVEPEALRVGPHLDTLPFAGSRSGHGFRNLELEAQVHEMTRTLARLDRGEPMPDSLREHAVYDAGPAKTPQGLPSGSSGPTTGGRMDGYVERFQAAGGSLVMLAKGNRSTAVTESCKLHGGFSLGSIGGPAARLAQDCITQVHVLETEELGMEAVWRIEVEDPAFVVVDADDFFAPKDTSVPVTIGRRPADVRS